MKTNLLLFCVAIILLTLTSCASVKPYYQDGAKTSDFDFELPSSIDVDYSLYLTGGVSLTKPSIVLDAIKKDNSSPHSGLVLLGDVISLDEVTSKAIEENAPVIKTIKSLDESYEDFNILPWEKEWSSGRESSFDAISSLDQLLKDVKKDGRLIEPKKGCGAPEAKRINDDAVIVFVDSQWAIETETTKGEKLPGCELANVIELRKSLKDIIQSYPDDHIIFAVHHPLYANGPTAGNYPLSSHLLPVPILGTVITGIKSLVSSNQHFGHPAYEAYRSSFISAMDGCKNCIVVSGHEKSLQYYYRNDVHYLVTGSGDEVTHARKGEKSGFSYMSRGFVRADVLTNGHLQLSFIAVDEKGGIASMWKKDITPYRADAKSIEVAPDVVPNIGDSILMEASTRYGDKKFLRGNFYREAWSKKIKMPVLWLDKIYGGLTPVQLGGGNQTRSLRLENKKGEQYVLRSIDKRVTSVLPPALRGTFAENIVQDGIAASHPYGALVVPRLAMAAGLYYTRPSVVYVPHQKALGIYNQEIGDGVYLFEDRPGGNTSGLKNFGNTEETFNTLDVIELVTSSPKNIVDQEAVLRARLFDIWLGDWDRHDDQWRWAAFKEKGMTVYRPIPRDRDQVFFKNDGLLDYLGSRPYFNPPLRKFDDEIDYLPGLVWAGKYFDRSFLHKLTEEDFIDEAKDLQSALNDNVINEAFLAWPAEIDSLDGEDIRSFLRMRRDDLVRYASEYYKHLSKEVAVPATDDQDIITVNATDDHHLTVTVDRKTDAGTQRFFERTISDDETSELRLFGLAKRDTFHIIGPGNPSILIRSVGGTGEDVLTNDSKNLKIIAYDASGGMNIDGQKVIERLNDKPFNNSYNRTDWKLNKSFHFPSPAYFTDEGFGLSYNIWWMRNGFRADPFKSNHALSFSYFFNTGAFIGHYAAEWPHAFGEVDFTMDAFVTGPTFTQYFYGLGNEYVDYGQKNKYHIVKGSQIRLSPSIGKRFGFGSRIYISPTYHFLDLENSPDRFVNTPASGLTADDFGKKHYAGINLGYSFERLDNPAFPTRGGELSISVGGRKSLNGKDITHGLLSGGGALYIPFDVTGNIVLATHVQADKILGDYEFFHALTLGGPDKLRGFKRDRFAGDTRFYHATDLRIKLFQNRGVVPFSLGVYGAVDYGRVWYEGDDADADKKWHTAFGGGIYIVPLGLTAFRLGYMVGEDDKQLNLGGALRF
ncbi:MAG TPA: BamA/TamA family outer membrane protein [Saprospiraceae bacterium]|nr:BamA/TamA family outer membrane protein [Saprospiraceae bacterium]